MKKRTIKNILSLGICIILMFTSVIVTSTAQETSKTSLSINNNPQLTITLYGSLRTLLLPMIGFDIKNVGDESAYDVSATFTVDGGFSDMIYFSETYYYTEILPDDAEGIAIMNGIFGFGPITVSLSVEASNVDTVEKSATGFQIGYRSFIFG